MEEMQAAGRFGGKIAVVSGAASGIGRAVAFRLSGEGAYVVVADINAEGGARVVEAIGPDAEYVKLDVTDPQSWRNLVETTRARDGVDVLVNAAGILKAIDLETDDLAAFTRLLDVNVMGTMLGCKALTPKLRQRGDAAIVNLGSVSAYTGTWNLIAYDASKGAVRNMTKELASTMRAMATGSVAMRSIPVSCRPRWSSRSSPRMRRSAPPGSKRSQAASSPGRRKSPISLSTLLRVMRVS
jgi:NAD(P)-dependent dehydrogenase (short-subunit alcohol dehydrogenase family)